MLSGSFWFCRRLSSIALYNALSSSCDCTITAMGLPPIIIIRISMSLSRCLLSYSSNCNAIYSALRSSSTTGYYVDPALPCGGFFDSSLALSFSSLTCDFNSSFSFLSLFISCAWASIFLVVPDSSSLSCLIVYCAFWKSARNFKSSCLA